MQLRVFSLPMEGDASAEEECNRFLRGQRVLSLRRTPVIKNGRHYWSVLVDYLPKHQSETRTDAAPGVRTNKEERTDYRELLGPAQFALYLELRQLRKRLSEEDKVPVYALMTNAQMAEIVRMRPSSKAELSKVPNLGPAKLDRLADQVLEMVKGWPVVQVASSS